MKKYMLKILSSLLVISMALLLLTACSQSGQTNKTPEKKKIDFPTKPIKVIVPYAAGGGTDITARVLAEEVTKQLKGKNVVVENKPGGSGVIGTTEVANSNPDGYTLLETQLGPLTVQSHLGVAKYKYTDLEPILGVVSVPCVMVVKSDAQWNTLEDILDYTKNNPDKFTYGTPGKGVYAHLAAEDFAEKAGIKMTAVFFDGTSTATAALMGGHIQGVMAPANDVKSLVTSGQAKVLFTTGQTEIFPKATVLKDKGINATITSWTAVFAPKGLPQEVKVILHDAYKAALQSNTVIEAFLKLGYSPYYASPEEFKKIVENEYKLNEGILKRIGLMK